MLFSPIAGLGFRIGRESLNGLGFSRINAYRPPTTSDTQFVRTARYSAKWMPMPFSPEGTHVSVITLSVPDCSHTIKDDVAEKGHRPTFNNFQNDISCVALYRFENGALTVDSKGANTLTNTGGATSNTTNEKEGDGCADFESTSANYLEIADADLSDNFPFKNGTTNGKMTVCCWFWAESWKGQTESGNNCLVSKYDTTSNLRSFSCTILSTPVAGTGNYLEGKIGHTAGTASEGNTVITISPHERQWYHYAYTIDAATRAYTLGLRNEYGDVIYEYSGSYANDISYTTAPLGIGTQYAGGAALGITQFDGLIDEMVIFNRVLTSDEITKIAQGQYDYESVTIASSTHTLTNDEIVLTVTVGGAGALLDLVVADGRQPQSAESPTLTQERTLVVSDSRHPQSAESPTLTKDLPALVVADSRHWNHTPVIILGLDTEVIGLASSRHQQTADSPTITLEQTLIVADVRHNVTHDAINLTVEVFAGGDITLTVADSRHPQTAESPTLSVEMPTLVVADSRHPQTAESPTLTQERTLVVSDSSHRQTAESPTLTQEITLVVADSRHPQVSDSPTLQQDKTLVVADCSNRNFTAAINLQQDLALLVVSDARHNLTNDTINLTIGADVVLTLTVAESRHTNTSDIIILPRERTLTVADSRHTDTSDAIALQQERTLVVSGITHTNRPDPIALLQKIVLSVQGSGHTVTNDIVGFAYEMMLGIAGDRITNIPDSIALSIDLWGALGLFHETSMQDITPDRTITGLIPLSIVNMTAEREIEEYGKLSMVDITDERNVA